jgi:hypothetical protein
MQVKFLKLNGMKKVFLFFVVIAISTQLKAQESESAEPFFKKENIFTGGSLDLGFGNQSTTLGISPFIGYSFNKYIDFAVSPGINYISMRDYNEVGDKLRQTIYGPGCFVRLFPVKFLFAQAQYEFNLMKIRYIYPSGVDEKYQSDSHSLLVGGGIASGRDFNGQKSYYYFSIMWDIGESMNSPYKDGLQRALPIIRAGYNIALFQGRQRQSESGERRRGRYRD